MFETLAIGRIVHYVMADADYTKEGAYGSGSVPVKGTAVTPRIRPAIIVEPWDAAEQPPEKQAVNLVVFVDGMNDGYPSSTMWKTSVPHVEKDFVTQGSWHWPR